MQLKWDQRGMSLIEVMIAVSILSLIMVGVMTMSKNMEKSAKSAEKKSDIEQVVREIQTLLADKENCSATVMGAAATGNTVITSIKQLNSAGTLVGHTRLRSSTQAAPTYVSKGMIINGMFLKWLSNTASGANFELHVTFMKSVKAGGATAGAEKAKETFYGSNLVTRVIPLQIDNCTRYVAFGVDAASAQGFCVQSGGTPTGSVVSLFSDSAPSVTVPDNHYAVACRVCDPVTRPRVNGCI